MTDLFTAIHTAISSIASGGVFLAQAPPHDTSNRPIPLPYAVVIDLGSSFEFTSGDPYIDSKGVQVSIYSDTQASGETARALLRTALDAKQLFMAGGGSMMMCLPQAEQLTREDDNLWHTRVDYLIHVHRTL